MNQDDWRGALIRRLLLLCCGSLLLGLLTDQYGWSLALGLLLYLGWMMAQLLRLHAWLKRQQPDDPPPEGADGLWGEVFETLYQTQRHEQRARARLQAVIDRVQESTAALQDAVVIMDRLGNLEWCNRAADTLLGLRERDIGQPVTNLVRHPAFKDYIEQGRYQDPLELASPHHDHRHLQFTVTRYGNDERLLLVRDVTRLHQLEQMRKDFVANVSHELRTPLTVIAGYLETLQQEPDAIPQRWRRPLRQMEQQTERMQNLLDDLLLLAKLEASQPPLGGQPVAVDRLLRSVCNDAQALSGEQAHLISLDTANGPNLRGSEAELRSAFSNLVFNAVKYTPAGGSIHIRWWGDRDGAHFAVDDNGIGIDSKHLPRLTERFYRVDASRSSQTGGTGLGLAIVKHVLLRHNGRLEIHSVPGQGSRFICHFPGEQIAGAVGQPANG